MAITDTLNLNAQQVAEQNPELHEMRQKFFGQDYLSDIEKGDTGTVQYYTGLGDPNAINYTEAPIEEPVIDTSTPVVDTGGGGGGGGKNVVTGGDGIMSTAPAMDQAAAIEAMTQPEAYDIPGTMPLTPVSGAFGPFDYLQPTTPITQDPMTGDAEVASAIAAQDRQDAFDQQFAFEDAKTKALSGIGPDVILPEARPDNLLPEGFDPYFSLEAPGITPFERATQLEETPIMYSEFDDLEADPGTQPIEGITPEAQSAWEKVKSGVSTAGDFIKNYGTAAYNLLKGSPVGAAVNLLTQPFTSSESQIEYESYSPETKQAVDQAYGPGGLMEGYNTVSMMGEGVEATIQDRIDTINKTLETKDSEILEARKTELTDLLNTVQGDKEGQAVDSDTAVAAGIEASDTDPADRGIQAANVDFSQERTDENISQAIDDLAAQYDRSGKVDETITSDVSKAKDVIGMPQNLGDVGQSQDRGGGGYQEGPPGQSGKSAAPSQSKSPGHPSNIGGGGGGSGGGGKIVCTMMNDSYGFGSFRNKIWLRQSKNLAPEYQIGYHKIFLPLVKLSKKNIVLKKILEHIAVHRTIDIRQESRGKTHMLGRVYRKILEPICYWVGKYGKRT